MTVLKCDMCKKIIDIDHIENSFFINITQRLSINNEKFTYDLCPDCMDHVDAFIRQYNAEVK